MMPAPSNRVVLKDDPDIDFDEGSLQFRLTYQGILLAETLRSGAVQRTRAEHKHRIRKTFHCQIKRPWEITPYLVQNEQPLPPPQHPGVRTQVLGLPGPARTIPELSRRFSRFDYHFVPLVTRDLDVLCSVDVLFLRPDAPGAVIRSGDIDNRLKTLFDALTMPGDALQVSSHPTPEAGEDPFFCLLEDDSLITRAAVETDVLLEPVTGDPNDVRVVVTVKLWPFHLRVDNICFG
jgi:hypothetical protein